MKFVKNRKICKNHQTSRIWPTLSTFKFQSNLNLKYLHLHFNVEIGNDSSKEQPDWVISASLNFSPRYIANLKPTLSYCKSVNIRSPNLLLPKVARYEKLYFGPFALRFGSSLHRCLFILHNAHEHHALPCFLPTPSSALLCPLLLCPPALHYPVMPYLPLPYHLLPCLQTLQFLAEATVRFCDWYIYTGDRRCSGNLCKSATSSSPELKEIKTWQTTHFEDNWLNCGEGLVRIVSSWILTTPWPRPFCV